MKSKKKLVTTKLIQSDNNLCLINISSNPQVDFVSKVVGISLNAKLQLWLYENQLQLLLGMILKIPKKNLATSWGPSAQAIKNAKEMVNSNSTKSQLDSLLFSKAKIKKDNLLEGRETNIYFPLIINEKFAGIIEFVYDIDKTFSSSDHFLMKNITMQLWTIFENERRDFEIKKLSDVAKRLREVLDFNQAMQYIVDSAQHLFGSESSTLFLHNSKTDSFVVGFRAPHTRKYLKSSPRAKRGLTRKIFDTGNPILINDVFKDENVRESVKKRGIQSLIGVRLKLENEKLGVLYINGKQKRQFSNRDIHSLQVLANYASLALGRWRFILKSSNEIERATANIFNIEKTIEKMVEDIENQFDFDYISVQLIDKEEQVIETIYGTNIAKKWSGLAKHYLEKEKELRDLQADIVLNCCTEIMNTNDNRMDKYIYEKIQEKNISRITTPLIVYRDLKGDVINYCRKDFGWKILYDMNSSYEKQGINSSNKAKQHTIIGLRNEQNKSPRQDEFDVIGTIGAGYKDGTKIIEPQEAVRLNQLLSKWAPKIYCASLQSVLETIVKCAMESIRADSATLHFLRDEINKSYVYEVSTGKITSDFLKRFPPRREGIGTDSIMTGDPQCAPDIFKNQSLDYLKTKYDKLYNEGIKAIAAFPLKIENKVGVLYIHFHRLHYFTEDEIDLIRIFSIRACDAIRHATAFTKIRSSAQHFSVLNSISQSISRTPQGTKLLRDIAWNTVNLLAADIVTIYEYIETEDRFIVPPEIAGRLKYKREMETRVKKIDAPYLIIRGKKNVWSTNSSKDDRLRGPHDIKAPNKIGFVEREMINSSAGILLRLGSEIVGVMFINYRRKHEFHDDEKIVIKTLAAHAAISIKNRRLLESLGKIDKEILTSMSIDSILNFITKHAVRITKADIGEIRLIDYYKKKQIVQSVYPKRNTKNHSLGSFNVNHGICGAVFASKVPILSNDVKNDIRYAICDPKTKSEICVPLISKHKDLIGLLNVESYRKGAFDNIDQRMLETLANRALIAIQNSQNYKQLCANQSMADIGDVAFQITHWLNRKVGAIKFNAGEIINNKKSRDENKEAAHDINNISNQIIREVKNLHNQEISEYPTGISCNRTIETAIRKVQIPINISVNLNIEKKASKIIIHRTQLIYTLSCLIQNAIDSMGKGGVLALGARMEKIGRPRRLVIWIEDTGIGISEKNQELIFVYGFTTKSNDKGLGFGLWGIKRFIERVGGQINVESELDEGTTFTLKLPCDRI